LTTAVIVSLKKSNISPSCPTDIDTITGKLNKACYIVRKSKQYLSNYALKMVYFACFHSVMSFGLIFWGNSTHSKCVFKFAEMSCSINNGSWEQRFM
jgi:hypothetical protein